MEGRPKFLSVFFKSAAYAYERRGVRALVPWWLLIGLVAGGSAAWQMPSSFWQKEQWEVSTTLYTGFLAFDGLLLALGWGAFSRIYGILSTGWFAAFLRRNDLLEDHLFFIDFTHGVLVASAISSGCGLVVILLPFHTYVDMAIFALTMGSSFWALVKALSAVKLMNDLVWDAAHSEPDQKPPLRSVGNDQ